MRLTIQLATCFSRFSSTHLIVESPHTLRKLAAWKLSNLARLSGRIYQIKIINTLKWSITKPPVRS